MSWRRLGGSSKSWHRGALPSRSLAGTGGIRSADANILLLGLAALHSRVVRARRSLSHGAAPLMWPTAFGIASFQSEWL